MKICIPALGIDNRGGTRVLIELANRLNYRGHNVSWVIPSGTNRSTYPIDPGVKVYEVGPRLPQIEDISSIMRLGFLLPGMPQCDLVVANYYLTAYPAARAVMKKKARAGVYLLQHYEPLAFGEAEKTFPRLKRRLAENTYRLPLRQVAVARWIGEKVKEFSKQEIPVIHPGVNQTLFYPEHSPIKGNRKRTILVLPGSDRWKGWQDFTQAFENVKLMLPEIDVIAVSSTVFPLPESGYSAFHPKDDQELAELYRSADVYVHPAWWEGCPLAPLEAMACGTPVVAAASEGIQEYAVHGENCWLVPPKNPAALADGIFRVLTDEALKQKLIGGGLTTSQGFKWDRMANEIENYFINVLGDEVAKQVS